MKFIRPHLKLIAVAVSCVALGAGASAIATAGAASGTRTRSGASAKAARGLGLRRLAARAVHGDLVVATRSGFSHVVFDRGTIQSVSGRELTLREATKKASYATVTLTIPSDARIRANGAAVGLDTLQPGQRALVVQAPKRTYVWAHTPARR